MSTRIVKLKLLTQVSLVSIETDVRTLEQFKALPEVEKLDIKWNQSKLIDRATKNSIDLDSALLPAIDCIIFVTPTKTESGATPRQELYAQIATLKQLGVEVSFNYTQASSQKLQEFIDENTSEPVIETPSPVSPNYTTREVIQRVIIIEETPVGEELVDEDAIIEEVFQTLADFITVSEIQEEYDDIIEDLNK